MSELKELRKRLLNHYDTMIGVNINETDHLRGYLSGLRTSLELVNSMIIEEENEVEEYYMKDELSKL